MNLKFNIYYLKFNFYNNINQEIILIKKVNLLLSKSFSLK